MKLTCVTAVFNAIKSGNRENLIRCVRSVAALKTEHEHLIYDGGSTDGTVELLRDLEEKYGKCLNVGIGECLNIREEKIGGGGGDRRREDDLISDCCAREDTSTTGVRANSALRLRLSPPPHPRLRVVSEPDTGIYNALNKGVRDARGDWFYVLGCDDYICAPEVMDEMIAETKTNIELIIAPVKRDVSKNFYMQTKDLAQILWTFPYSHQSVLMRTGLLRELNGFDEKYRFCADWDMLFKCHLSARKFHYTLRPFAFYASGGLSERPDVGNNDWSEIYKKFYGYSDAQYRRFRQCGTPHLMAILQYLFHNDLALRMSARMMLVRKIKKLLRVLFYPALAVRRAIKRRLAK